MLPGDRLVCAFANPVNIGDTFTKWLLHVTIVPWFRLDDSSEQLAHGLQSALSPIAPFRARVGEEIRFGPKKNRPAHVLETSPFTEVEARVRSYLHKKRAWLVDETTKVQRPYRPHVTFQGPQHLQTGDQLYCDRVYIVEQNDSYKTVVAEVPFGTN